MKPRFRLLPVVIFVAALTLTLKLASIWHGAEVVVFAPGVAAAKDDVRNDDDRKADAEKHKADKKDGKKDTATAESKSPSEKESAEAERRFNAEDVTEDELVVLQKLSARRAELERRSGELELRENVLKATESRIEAKIAELTEIKKTIEGLLKKHEGQREAKLRSLVKIYENMKPKNAARIFEQLDMPVLLDVVERMREAKTAPILAKMAPSKAKTVTTELASRRSLPIPKKSRTN